MRHTADRKRLVTSTGIVQRRLLIISPVGPFIQLLIVRLWNRPCQPAKHCSSTWPHPASQPITVVLRDTPFHPAIHWCCGITPCQPANHCSFLGHTLSASQLLFVSGTHPLTQPSPVTLRLWDTPCHPVNHSSSVGTHTFTNSLPPPRLAAFSLCPVHDVYSIMPDHIVHDHPAVSVHTIVSVRFIQSPYRR